MYLIVGLGNPEPEYSRTRHNMGFDTINMLAEKHNIKVEKQAFCALYNTGIIENEKVMLCKPQTFMNLSGTSIIKFVEYFKINIQNVIVIYDDIDLSSGTVKVRKKGGPGTHNGMKSVVENLASEDFLRIRIGIGKPEYKGDLINYVIEKMPEEEYKKLFQGISKAEEAVEQILSNGVDNAMNVINIKS